MEISIIHNKMNRDIRNGPKISQYSTLVKKEKNEDLRSKVINIIAMEMGYKVLNE